MKKVQCPQCDLYVKSLSSHASKIDCIRALKAEVVKLQNKILDYQDGMRVESEERREDDEDED